MKMPVFLGSQVHGFGPDGMRGLISTKQEVFCQMNEVTDEELEREQLAQVRRRILEVEMGSVRMIPADGVFRSIRESWEEKSKIDC